MITGSEDNVLPLSNYLANSASNDESELNQRHANAVSQAKAWQQHLSSSVPWLGGYANASNGKNNTDT